MGNQNDRPRPKRLDYPSTVACELIIPHEASPYKEKLKGGKPLRIRELRQARGLSQARVAADMGVSKPSVCKWETGVSVPRTEILPQLARVLGCSIDELFDDRPPGGRGEAAG